MLIRLMKTFLALINIINLNLIKYQHILYFRHLIFIQVNKIVNNF